MEDLPFSPNGKAGGLVGVLGVRGQKVFFFFKQKTAYEISLGLVGSEMCIRDRIKTNKPR